MERSQSAECPTFSSANGDEVVSTAWKRGGPESEPFKFVSGRGRLRFAQAVMGLVRPSRKGQRGLEIALASPKKLV